jgi:hypothetical protein
LRQQAAGLDQPAPDPSAVRPVEALQKKRRTSRIPTTGDRDALLAAVRSSAARTRPELEQPLEALSRDPGDPQALHALCVALIAEPELWQPVRRQLEPFVQLPGGTP